MTDKATIATSQVSDTQQNVRLAMELLAQDLRLASYNYVANGPGTPTVGGCAVTNGAISLPVGIRPLDQNIAAPGADTGPDSVSMVVPVLTNVVTPWVLSANVGGTGPDPVPFNQLPMTAASITDMQTNGLAVGSVVSIGGAGARAVTSVGAAAITIGPAGVNFEGKFPAGTAVYLLQCVTYAISTNPAVCGTGSGTCLTRNGIAFVDGIEDIQFSYACDGCSTAGGNPLSPDGVIDEIDGVAGRSKNDFVSNSAWNLIPMTPDKIKQVSVNVVARQLRSDGGFGEKNTPGVNTTGPVIVGDHNPSADPGYNATTYAQQRRRVLTRIIQPRNM
jgi:type IV pilus assembly protein PilW